MTVVKHVWIVRLTRLNIDPFYKRNCAFVRIDIANFIP